MPDDIAEQLVDELAQNYRDGASVMARQALVLVERYVDAIDEDDLNELLPPFVSRLGSARPSMVAIARVVHEWQQLFDLSPKQNREAAHRAAQLVGQRIEEATAATVRAAVEALRNFHAILTHSSSSTLLRAVESLSRDDVSVIATESNPGREGIRVVQSLVGKGYRCALVRDKDAVSALTKADVLAVGADAILKNGDIVNKVGTCPLAEAAYTNGVPMLVVAESFKDAGVSVTLEDAPGGKGPLFDVTPKKCITCRIGDNVFTGL